MAIDAVGQNGGLALLWKDDVDITVQVLSNSIIQINVLKIP